jgi:hypothetical protein
VQVITTDRGLLAAGSLVSTRELREFGTVNIAADHVRYRAPLERDVKVEEIYVNVAPPRRQWRVVERRHNYVKLVRKDNPNIMRFPHESVLLDKKRYRRI